MKTTHTDSGIQDGACYLCSWLRAKMLELWDTRICEQCAKANRLGPYAKPARA